MPIFLRKRDDDEGSAVPVAFRAQPLLVEKLAKLAEATGHNRSQALNTLLAQALELESALSPYQAGIERLMKEEGYTAVNAVAALVGRALKSR